MNFKTTVRKKKYDDLMREQRESYSKSAKSFIMELVQDSTYLANLGHICGNYDRHSYLEFVDAVGRALSVVISPNPYGNMFCLRVNLRSRMLRQILDHKLSSNLKSLIHKREDLFWIKDILGRDADVLMDLNIDWDNKKERPVMHARSGNEFIEVDTGVRLNHQFQGSDRGAKPNWFRTIMDQNADSISQLVLGEIDNE